MEGNTGFAAQVAIPQLRRYEQQVASSSKPPRVRSETVNKACMRCRKRKTKCSGTRPRCTSCEKHDDECVFEQPRRDRLRDAMHKNETLIALLKDVRGGLSEEHGTLIDDTLQQYQDDTPPSTPVPSTRTTGKRPRAVSDDMDRNMTPPNDSRIESKPEADEEDEDASCDQGLGSIGYLGRNSQVQWMRTLQRKLESSQHDTSGPSHDFHGDAGKAITWGMHDSRRHAKGPPATQALGDCYFYLDSTLLDDIDNVDTDVVPPVNTAKQLFGFYQDAVHTPFRILDGQFEGQLRTFYEMMQRGHETNFCPRWRAMMNLVFAIGSHLSLLAGANRQNGDFDQHVYMSRAIHLLGLHKLANFAGPPNQSLIQATGLLSFYLLIIGHVNRAWNMIGASLRHAQAAGFHLENEDPSSSPTEKGDVSQIWRALHSIECILTSITGRPRIIDPRDCTVALSGRPASKPGALTHASSAHETHMQPPARHRLSNVTEELTHVDASECLRAWSKLDVIQHKVLTNLYSARSVRRSWDSIQTQISTLMAEMEEWAQDALASAGSDDSMVEQPRQTREHVLLFFYYQSARICVTRPCLCRLDRRMEDRSESSTSFVQDTADTCIQAALDIASALPKHTSYHWLYEMGPWWSAIHIIMQAITVLLLELTQRTSSLSRDPFYIFACVENLVQWLKALKAVDRVAENAYRLVCNMLRKYKRFTKDGIPEQWLAEETAELPNHHDANLFAEDSARAKSMSHQPYMPQADMYPFPHNLERFGTGREYPSPNPLEDAFGGFQFGQTQYTPLFISQFTTLFDQRMEDENDDTQGERGWYPPFG